jgi:hypothetical protein
MNIDNLNFRGKFRQYDADGKSYLYKIGDVVEHKGNKYVAIKSTSNIVPNTANADSTWQRLSAAGGSFYIQDDPPVGAVEGDRWFRPTPTVLFTLIKQETDMIWVEL